MGSCFKNIFRWGEVFSLQQLLAWQAAQVRRNQGGGGLLQLWSLAFVAIGPYLIIGIFLHEQNFWRIKFTPKKRGNYDKIHRKLPIFVLLWQNTQ